MKKIVGNIKIRLAFLENRILWADIAKCLAIFLVIWGHAGSGNQVIFYRSVFYSFHLPAFLLVSGFLMRFPKDEERNLKGILTFIFKNLLLIIFPYIFWGIFTENFTIANILPILYGSYQSIKTVNVIGALWFIPAFFFARLFAYLLMFAFQKLKYRKIFLGISMAVLFAIGFVLPLLDKGYFWSFNIAFVLSGFIVLGVILKEVLDKLSKAKWWVILIVFVCAFTGFFFGTFFRGDQLELVCTYNGNYGNPFWYFYNSIFGTAALVSLSMLIAKADCKFVRGIQYVGTQTLGILIFHVPVMRQVMMPFFTDLGFVDPDWLVAFVAALCTLIICLAFNTLVVLLCPELVGQKRKQPSNN